MMTAKKQGVSTPGSPPPKKRPPALDSSNSLPMEISESTIEAKAMTGRIKTGFNTVKSFLKDKLVPFTNLDPSHQEEGSTKI